MATIKSGKAGLRPSPPRRAAACVPAARATRGAADHPATGARALITRLTALLFLLTGCYVVVIDTPPEDAGSDAPAMVCEPQTGNCNGLGCVDSLTSDPNCSTCGNDCRLKGETCEAVGPDVFGCVPLGDAGI
jgi:hypothetical protein